MQVLKYLKSFLGVMAVSFFISVPVHAATLTTEMYDKVYDSFSSTSKSFTGTTDASYTDVEFRIDFATPIAVNDIYRSGITMIDGGDGRVITTDNAYFFPTTSPVSYIRFKLKPNSSYSIYFRNSSGTLIAPTFKPKEQQATRPVPPPVPTPTPTPDSFITLVVDSIVKAFLELKKSGIIIVTTAISLGVVFIGGKWLWGKTKQWLSNV